MRFCCENAGIYDFYNEENVPNAIYPEIIGYYLTYISYLKSLQISIPNEIVEHAKRTITLLGESIHNSGIPVKIYSNMVIEKYYGFDLAMIGNGLLSFKEVFNNSEFDETIIKVYTKLVDNFFENNLLKCAVITEDTLEENWSHHLGQYHLKLILFLHKMNENFKVENKNLIESLKKQIIENYLHQDLLINDITRKGYHLHPYCYGVEGLLYHYHFFKKNEDRDELRRIDKKMFSHQFPLRYVENGIANKTIRNDITAQLLRIHKYSNFLLGDLNTNKETIELLNKILEEYELECGSYSFGQNSKGLELKHPNSWVTFMSHQTYLMSSENMNLSLRYMI